MIVPREVAEQVDVKTPEQLFELIHNVSLYLLIDDKSDLGRFQYYGRDDHYYHGKHSPDHPSPFHHWQIGILGLIVSQLGSIMTKASEMYNTFQAVESGDYSAIDNDILEMAEDDNTISLEDYKNEVSSIPLQSDKEDLLFHNQSSVSSSIVPSSSSQDQTLESSLSHTLIRPKPKPLLLF